MKSVLIFLLAAVLAVPAGAQGLGGASQMLVPTKLSTALSQPAANVGDEVELLVNARIQPTWHLYATDFSEEVGPVVFTLTFEPGPAYQLVGKPVSVKSHHAQDPVFKGEVAYWEKTGQIRQRIRLLQPGALTIKATADYQSCTDVDGRCVPGNDQLTFGPFQVAAAAAKTPAATATPPVSPARPAGPAAPKSGALGTEPAATIATAGNAATGATPAAPASANPDALASTTSSASAAAASAGTTANPAADSGQAGAAGPASAVAADAAPSNLAGPSVTAASATSAADPGNGLGLWQYLVLAFGAGLLAVIMPCVYPMLPMTVSYFTSTGGTRARGIGMAVVYALSIIGIYTGAGVLLSLLFGADAANLISSHWLPNVLSFVIFIVFGLSFLGLFEINAPSALVNKTDAQADKGGWSGLFFMAATLVLVSFSCTVPIVGSVAIAAANGELLRPTLGMLSFSTAFALPFLLFALFPTWLKSLPRSGGWLNVLKVVLGFFELALAFKFLSSADLSYHWGLLPRPVFLTIWLVLAALLGFYLLGKIRLPHDSPTDTVSVPRLLLAAVAFVFAVYLVPGLFGAPLPALSALAPPPSRHDFTLGGNASSGIAPALSHSATQPLCEAPRHAETLELPLGLTGYFNLEQALRCARAQGKPVFVDFTGHNCGNCRRMEAEVWSNEQVLNTLRNDYVVVALYADDKTTLPAAEHYTSARDQHLKKTIGEQNLDFQITRFQANAQPYYVLLDPNDPTGAPLAPPVAYEPDAAKFQQFLARGLAAFRQPVAAH